MFTTKPKILITGAYGFIGSYLLKRFLKMEFDAWGISSGKNSSPIRLEHVQRNKVIEMPIEFFFNLKNDKDKLIPKFDYVIHTASYGNYHWQKDHQKITFHFYLLSLILEYCRQSNAKLIHLGSSSEYGNLVSEGKEDLNHPISFPSVYGITKFSQNHLIYFYGKNNLVRCINLKLFSIYGPGEHPNRLIPAIVRAILLTKKINLVNYHTERDFVFIEDLFSLIKKIIEQFPDHLSGESFNVATGRSISINDIEQWIQQNYPKVTIIKNLEHKRPWDTSHWKGDTTKTHQKLNWKAQTSFESGLIKNLDFYQTHINLLEETAFNPWPKITFIITCYNHYQPITILIENIENQIKNKKVRFEILIIDDHDKENSYLKLKPLLAEKPYLKIIRNQTNLGSQLSILRGIILSQGDAIITMDGDMQDPPEIAMLMIDQFLANYDIVLAQRYKRKESFFIQNLRHLFYKIWNLLCINKIPIGVGDFSLVKSNKLELLKKYPPSVFSWRSYRINLEGKVAYVKYERPCSYQMKTTNTIIDLIKWGFRFLFSLPNYIALIITIISLLINVTIVIAMINGISSNYFYAITIWIFIWITITTFIIWSNKHEIHHTQKLNDPYLLWDSRSPFIYD